MKLCCRVESKENKLDFYPQTIQVFLSQHTERSVHCEAQIHTFISEKGLEVFSPAPFACCQATTTYTIQNGINPWSRSRRHIKTNQPAKPKAQHSLAADATILTCSCAAGKLQEMYPQRTAGGGLCKQSRTGSCQWPCYGSTALSTLLK